MKTFPGLSFQRPLTLLVAVLVQPCPAAVMVYFMLAIGLVLCFASLLEETIVIILFPSVIQDLLFLLNVS